MLLWSTSHRLQTELRELDAAAGCLLGVFFHPGPVPAALAPGSVGAADGVCPGNPGYFPAHGPGESRLYYLVLLRAYDLLPAQQAQAINHTWAISLAVLAVPLLGHKLHRRDLLALAMGYCGVLVIATAGRRCGCSSTVSRVGWSLLSTLIWALYWLVSTRNQRDPVACLCLNFAVAAPVSLVLCAVFSSLVVPGWRGLAGAAWVGLFEMGVTFALWSTALRLSSGVSRIGNLIFLSPLVSLVFIGTILGEAIHPATLLGLALIIPGVLLQQRSARPWCRGRIWSPAPVRHCAALLPRQFPPAVRHRRSPVQRLADTRRTAVSAVLSRTSLRGAVPLRQAGIASRTLVSREQAGLRGTGGR